MSLNFPFKSHFSLNFSPFSARQIGGVKPTDGTGCPRCGFAVYEAEKMISKKNSWHKRCFNCGDCHKSLDSTNLCDGPNGDIYCRGKFNVFRVEKIEFVLKIENISKIGDFFLNYIN